MTTDFTLSIHGTQQLAARLDAMTDFWTSPELRTMLEDTKNALVRLTRKAVPKNSRVLKGAVDGVIEDFGSKNPRVRWGIMNLQQAKYAKFVHDGTDPHPIFPRYKQVLRWTTKGHRGERVPTPPGIRVPTGLTEVFRDWVFHPGNKPNPFVTNQLAVIRPRFLMAIARLMKAKLSGQGGAPA